VTRAIFERDGDRIVPTGLARGPWDPGSCHGGAPAALLAAVLDQLPSPAPMHGVRLSFDLLRPVPLAPLTLASQVVRDGKRVQLAEATLTDGDGTELMRCRALRIRTTELGIPAPPPEAGAGDRLPDEPEQLSRFDGSGTWQTEGFWEAVDVRFLEGQLGQPGRGVAWFRVVAPLLEGLELTPLARAAATADFGNGIGPPLPMGPYLYVNPDLTVHLDRLPVGEWVGMRSTSVARPSGSGQTTSTLFDRDGRIGTAAQSLYVDEAG
jgi:hypothetical protein